MVPVFVPFCYKLIIICICLGYWIPDYAGLRKCRSLSCAPPEVFLSNADAYTQNELKIDPQSKCFSLLHWYCSIMCL